MSKALKILIISNHAGFSKFNAPYFELVKKCGAEVHNASPGIEVGHPNGQINVPITRHPISIGNILSLFQLAFKCHKEKYDIIHCHTPAGGLIGRLLKILYPRARIIYTVHGFHFFKGGPLFMWLIYFPIEFALSFLTHTLITINEEDRLIASNFFFAKRLEFINGVGVDLGKFAITATTRIAMRKSLDIQGDDFAIIYCAQLISRKNHRFILEAVSNYRNKNRLKVIFESATKSNKLKM
jgi:glycosyltransferase EpsD